MVPGLMREANTLAATSMQLGAGLAIAGATVALRVGDAVTSGSSAGHGQAAFTVAFCLLALVAAGCAAEALLMDPAAGNAARRPRSAATPPASSAQAG
jgi:high-affinity Fe2+/Pb2+ permease